MSRIDKQTLTVAYALYERTTKPYKAEYAIGCCARVKTFMRVRISITYCVHTALACSRIATGPRPSCRIHLISTPFGMKITRERLAIEVTRPHIFNAR
ncbi:hypothetical protein EG68_00431 [Paragonimus skrjabini miyazakii]|uniref:Uncharacterized protein n=1 Tax=Paragonimus skrjabini miyazakii TaxID=59628 RepID=A0A8S9Z8Y8_9TREM|nr:hypothetical protein EG68_00431 [Paragonimus skrjabini miyazakii]